MSRVYFTTEHEGTAELLGSERAWMGMLCRDLAAGIVPDRTDELAPRLTRAAPLRSMLDKPQLRMWIGVYLNTAADTAQFIDHDGDLLDTFDLVLNTALALGSDPVALMARLHAQCEIHCYVEGGERSWLADIIDAGLRDGVMRVGEGWTDVTTLLRSGQFHPVVCHYSVTDGFPNPRIAGWSPPVDLDADAAVDAWYGQPGNEQWRQALAGLRSRPERQLRLTPEGLRGRYGHCRSMLDLFRPSRRPAGVR